MNDIRWTSHGDPEFDFLNTTLYQHVICTISKLMFVLNECMGLLFLVIFTYDERLNLHLPGAVISKIPKEVYGSLHTLSGTSRRRGTKTKKGNISLFESTPRNPVAILATMFIPCAR